MADRSAGERDDHLDGTGGFSQATLDPLGRPTAIATRVFDGDGRLSHVTYPKATDHPWFRVRYDYSSTDFLESVHDVTGINGDQVMSGQESWAALGNDAEGRINGEEFGNGVTTKRSWDPNNGRLNWIQSFHRADNDPFQFLAYSYEVDGDVRQRTSTRDGQELTEDFTYDARHQLLSAQVSGQAARNYTYGDDGRLLTSPRGTLTYGSDAGPHAVTAVGSETYAYDGVGNLRQTPEFAVDYTAFHLPRTITAHPHRGRHAHLRSTRQPRRCTPP